MSSIDVVVDSLQCPSTHLPTFIIDESIPMVDTAMSQTKHCKRCDRTLPIEQFHNSKNMKDGKAFYCKECCSEYGRMYRRSPKGVYAALRSGKRYYKDIPINITQSEFIEWYEFTPKRCIYCKIPEIELYLMDSFYKNQYHRLTIDRKNGDVGYDDGNLVLACNCCNLIKQNVLTYDDMREIGMKYVRPKWVKRKRDGSVKDK